MTNRRKGVRSKSSKKSSASPEKPTRKSHRRSRRQRKSESSSPEHEHNDTGSDEGSVDDNESNREEQSEKKVDSNIHRSQRESPDKEKTTHADSYDDEQRKGEESAGSGDGSWKVKSDNSGGGGIPKLKLCLQRPNDSSPTSEQPSPRRRQRSVRGSASSPSKGEPSDETSEEKHTSKKLNRTYKSHEEEEKAEHKISKVTQNVCDSSQENENIGTSENVAKVESQSLEVSQEVCDSTEATSADDNIKQDNCSNSPNTATTDVVHDIDQNKIPKVLKTNEHVETSLNEKEKVKPETEPAHSANEDNGKLRQRFRERISKRDSEVHETDMEQDEIGSSGNKDALQSNVVPNASSFTQQGEEAKQEVQDVEETVSVQRDSSEERAKDAALKSRKKKREEESEEGEITESPERENDTFGDRLVIASGKNNSSQDSKSRALVADKIEERIPIVRKRRWGSSTISKTSKKPPLCISTDSLKEIIPEVRPLSLNEVHLSSNEDDEILPKDGKHRNSKSEEIVKKDRDIQKEKILPSDESEKDYEEEVVESGVDDTENVETTADPVVTNVSVEKNSRPEKETKSTWRKVSVITDDVRKLQRSPSPPLHSPSSILFITNLVRPFTIPQLRDLLARTGTIVENGFWIDKIKSKCYVQYENEDEAKTTRHALHGVRWPVSNPKQLNVDFGNEEEMRAAQEGNDVSLKRPIPSLFDTRINLEKDRIRDREIERIKSRREKDDKDGIRSKREKDKLKNESKEDEKEKNIRLPVEPLVRDRTVRRVTVPVREWDVGKHEEGFSPPPDPMEFSRRRDDKYERRFEYDRERLDRREGRDEYEEPRRRDRERGRRSHSGEPSRKAKKKEEEAPAKLLDDLFRKTKATPCIYWLPLTAEQIAVKEEMRRKHMAEHEKRVAEMRKKQREQSKRSSDKRRRRSKSRSRSRSARK